MCAYQKGILNCCGEEQAHIVGRTKTSTRGKSNLTKKERDSYYNLILLCPNHHTEIDQDCDDYTIEKLHLFKDQHEYWVEHTLSGAKNSLRDVHAVIYADLIDVTVEACQLYSWDKWVSRTLSTSMTWDADAPKRLFEFYNKIMGAVWPKTLPELECSLKRLIHEIYEAFQAFNEHSELKDTKRGEILREEKFYKTQG